MQPERVWWSIEDSYESVCITLKKILPVSRVVKSLLDRSYNKSSRFICTRHVGIFGSITICHIMILENKANKQENRASDQPLARGMKMSELRPARSWQPHVAYGILLMAARTHESEKQKICNRAQVAALFGSRSIVQYNLSGSYS